MENSENQGTAKSCSIWTKIEPIDIISVIIIVSGFYLKLRGGDGMVTALLSSIVFYYYGKRGKLIK